MQFWLSLMRALGKPDVSIDDAVPQGSEETIRLLREQRLAADQQVRLLRKRIPTADLFPMSRSFRPATDHE
jgi:hypothetical protein